MTECPRCGRKARIYADWKPWETVETACPHCGFRCYNTIEIMQGEDLAEAVEGYLDGKVEPLSEDEKARIKDFDDVYL